MSSLPTVTVLHKVETPSEPDVLQFSPLDPSLLVVGTYHLEHNGTRTGSLLLYSVNSQSPTCELIQTVHCAGAVLDANWHTVEREILVVALSTGCIALYELTLGGIPHLQHVNDFSFFPDKFLVLSLGMSSVGTSVISTLSTGLVSILDMEQQTPRRGQTWTAHDLEVWCSAWKSADTVLTGGDDALLKLWDLREDLQTAQIVCKRSLLFINLPYGSHNAGVTSILPVSDSLVFTGSYDNHLRLFDYRNFRQPVSSLDLDGGVWRILPRPGSNMISFLTCCMQTGGKMVSLNLEGKVLAEEGLFEPEEERRLIYGASWQDTTVAALCSFYEKSLYICRIP